MDTNDVDIGGRIKEQRKKQGMTQKELAEKIGISVHTLSKYEQNQREPNMLTIRHIASALEVPIITLLPYKQEDLEAMVKAISSLSISISDSMSKVIEPMAQLGQAVSEKYKMLFEQMEPVVKQLKERFDHDVVYLLEYKEKAYYNGHLLSEEERQRALDMLKLLFPEYQEEEE